MTLFLYIVAVIGTFGITKIITKYDGPKAVFLRLRERFEALECYVCTSVYVGAVLTLLCLAPDAIRWTTLPWIAAVIGGAYIVNLALDD